MTLLKPPSVAAPPEQLAGPARVAYLMTYFGRGWDTVQLAGLFRYAYELDCAAQALATMIGRAPKQFSGDTLVRRTTMLTVVQALVVEERNKLLDKFAQDWSPEALDPQHGADNEREDHQR